MKQEEYVKTIVYNDKLIVLGLDDYGQTYFIELDCVSTQTNAEDERDFLRYRTCYKVNVYKMTTEFNNVGEDSVLYELRLFNEEDCKDIKEHFDERFNTENLCFIV